MSALYKPGPGFLPFVAGAALVPVVLIFRATGSFVPLLITAALSLALIFTASGLHDRAHTRNGETGHALRGSDPEASRAVMRVCAVLTVVLVIAVTFGLAASG